MYCGTTTGDLLEVSLKTKNFRQAGPHKEAVRKSIVPAHHAQDHLSMGILSIAIAEDNQHIAVGSGDGTVALLKKDTLKVCKYGLPDTRAHPAKEAQGGRKDYLPSVQECHNARLRHGRVQQVRY